MNELRGQAAEPTLERQVRDIIARVSVSPTSPTQTPYWDAARQVILLIRGETLKMLDEPCPHESWYKKRQCEYCWQALDTKEE